MSFSTPTHTQNRTTWCLLSVNELKGVFRILYLFGIYQGQHQPIRELFSDGQPVFRAAFEQILQMLRFDDLLVLEINLHHFACFGIHST